MKDKVRMMTALTFLIAALAMPLVSSAQDATAQNHKPKHHHYKLIDIPALGGPNSSFGIGGYVTRTINSQGTAIAQGDTLIPDPYSMVGFDFLVNHPVQWRDGVLTDLGALPGVNSSLASWINSRGWVAGFSENGLTDPLTGFPETKAVLWKDGKIIDLGTLGGSSSGANAINSRGQVVGGALNSIPDPFSAAFTQQFIFETAPFYFFPVATQSHAFLWQDGKMQDLGTLGGPDSLAWFVNELGQVAGQSTIDSIPNATTGIPTVNPFFWDDGKMVNVGNLGGTYSYVSGLNNRGQMTGTMNLPGDGSAYRAFFWEHGVLTELATLGGDHGNANAINDSGEVVGFASNTGNQTTLAFLWKHGVITNLGTVDGDLCSAAHSLNASGQVVGESAVDCTFSTVHAFLWENNGPMVDLNSLIPPGSGMQLAVASSINDLGEIDGNGVLPNGDIHGFLLIPCDENHPDVVGCDYEPVETVNVDPLSAAQSLRAPLASPASLSPAEMLTRLRSSHTARNRSHGMPQTSPE